MSEDTLNRVTDAIGAVLDDFESSFPFSRPAKEKVAQAAIDANRMGLKCGDASKECSLALANFLLSLKQQGYAECSMDVIIAFQLGFEAASRCEIPGNYGWKKHTTGVMPCTPETWVEVQSEWPEFGQTAEQVKYRVEKQSGPASIFSWSRREITAYRICPPVRESGEHAKTKDLVNMIRMKLERRFQTSDYLADGGDRDGEGSVRSAITDVCQDIMAHIREIHALAERALNSIEDGEPHGN